MKSLFDCKNEIHSCSKCGLCQSVCPIYKITGNDCTVSRGHFIMLRGLIKGDLSMSKTINKYLELCLKCGACSKFCPSGIDVVDIVALAKAEYFNKHKIEKLKSFLLKTFVLSFLFNIKRMFISKTKSKNFDKKVIYFGGCSSIVGENSHVIKIMNSLGIEVISPNFKCCGMPFFLKGDMKTFNGYMDNFYKIIEKYGVFDIVTTCASCEKALKSYSKWSGKSDINVKNIFEYIRENNLVFKLKKERTVTFHKPCNLDNYNDVKYILDNTENLKYIAMEDYDKCCGFNGLMNFAEYGIMSKLFKQKRDNIVRSGAKIVLTSCIACQAALNLFSFGKYKTEDLTKFLAKEIVS